MKNKVLIGFLVIVAFALIAVFIRPSPTICADDVRGYETTASSSIEVARNALSKINSSASTTIGTKVAAQLDGLNATNFASIKACDTQCKLLDRCLRFVFFKPPSEACPTEYRDYKQRIDAASGLLRQVEGVAASAEDARKKADEIGRSQKAIEELANSSGATGGRVDQLKAQIGKLTNDLSAQLSSIDGKLDEIAKDQRKGG
ncbi:hypothetical protein [Bradyrhizobium monzae]|uniref:hypothetical protein n=1 Tax=Bradyrhizobium sp. Oc8 TaxID=2876780 RepID=UPI001F2E8E9E|nr:hypothetical protein [Bradyrhizobium sp. Oc8]